MADEQVKKYDDYYKGITVESGFKYPAGKPLDVRFVAKTREMAESLINEGMAYPGLVIWVKKWKESTDLAEEENVQVQCVPDKGTGELKLVRINHTDEDFEKSAKRITAISGGNASTW